MESFTRHFPRAVHLAQDIIRARLNPGDLAVDATVGNGHDTLFLAALVGAEGRIIGFDIQESAISATRQKTSCFPGVSLYQTGHQNVAEHLDQPLKAAMFNLGYLPGADKAVITNPETTIKALEELTSRLLQNGVITIVLYTGHDGGAEEASAIREWCTGLDQADFTVIEYGFLNQRNSPPSLIAIERK